MRTDFRRVFSLNKFLTNIKITDQTIKYNLLEPSILLLENIFSSWLQTLLLKIPKNMLLFTNKNYYNVNKLPSLPFGFLETNIIHYKRSTVIEQLSDSLSPKTSGHLSIKIFVPQQDSIQYFIQWQRYRKYWWSSINTTPSLFTINEINYEDDTADANITAQFDWGQHTVETIKMNTKDNNLGASCITCSTTLETALFILLLDGLSDSMAEEHLRLHRNMAPYKISFALNLEGAVNKQKLCELAELMNYKLKKNNITSFLPNFDLTMELQIMENLRLGVAYSAVLSETTLINGIIQLLNSSTMLKEQLHLADFDSYMKILCK